MKGEIESPCARDCQHRAAECHATCARYVDYQQKKFAEYEEKAHASDKSYANAEFYRKSVKRMKRSKRSVE